MAIYVATETGFRKVVRKIWKKSLTFRKKSHMPKLIFSIFEHFFIMTKSSRLVLENCNAVLRCRMIDSPQTAARCFCPNLQMAHPGIWESGKGCGFTKDVNGMLAHRFGLILSSIWPSKSTTILIFRLIWTKFGVVWSKLMQMYELFAQICKALWRCWESAKAIS